MRRSFAIAAKVLILAVLAFCCIPASAQTTGSISGTVTDPTGSVVPDIAIICRNVETGVQQNATTNAEGIYAFPILPVGHYELETFRPGFKPYKRTGLTIDVNTKLQVDIAMQMGEQSEQVTVSESAVQVETREHANGRRRYRPGDDCRGAERQELHRSAVASARHRADVDTDAGFGCDGWRDGGDPAFRQPESGEPIDQRPARRCQRIPRQRIRR